MSAAQGLALAALALQIWVTAQIWLVQIVVYPLFARVGAAQYVDYHRFYSRRIPVPVILPGFTTFAMPALLAILLPDTPAPLTAANIASSLIVLIVTFGWEIPRHNRLERDGKDERMIAELVRFNWPRSVFLTAQTMLTAVIAGHSFGWQPWAG